MSDHKLFYVRSNLHPGVFECTTFCWFLWDYDSPRKRLYADLIKDYDPRECNPFAEAVIDELFSEEQAVALLAYLDKEHGHESENILVPVALPIPKNAIGFSAMPVGGNDDFLLLWRRDGWNLPFRVAGYFRRDHQLANDGGFREIREPS